MLFLNPSGNFVVRVDNATDGSGNDKFGRPSIKLLSTYTINEGNLVLFDAVHIPFGVSLITILLENDTLLIPHFGARVTWLLLCKFSMFG